MLSLIFALLLNPQSSELTNEQMDDIQNHAEAALRLSAGQVLRPTMELALPEWAFEPMPWTTTIYPFED